MRMLALKLAYLPEISQCGACQVWLTSRTEMIILGLCLFPSTSYTFLGELTLLLPKFLP